MLNSAPVNSTATPLHKGGAGEQGERDIADGQGFVAGAVAVDLLRAAEHGADAGDQFAGIEGLGNVVVGADFKAKNAVHGFATGGEQNDGNAGVGAQGLEQFKSGAAREHDIEDHNIVFAAERGIEAGAMIEDGMNVEALVLQKALQQRDQPLVVVNDKYAAHAIYSARDRGEAVKNCYELGQDGSQKFTFPHRLFTRAIPPGLLLKERKGATKSEIIFIALGCTDER